MVLGTYANLNAIDEKTSGEEVVKAHQRPFYQIDHVNIEPNQLDKSVEVITMADVKNVTEYLHTPPKLIVQPINPKHHTIEKIPAAKPQQVDIPPETPPKPNQADINRDAILHEDAEIAAEAKQSKEDEELKKTNILVKEIKDELVKKQQETENLVMQKLGLLAEHIQHIEKVQENEISKTQHKEKVLDFGSELSPNKLDLEVQNKVIPNDQNKLQLTSEKSVAEVVHHLNEKAKVIPTHLGDPILTRLEEANKRVVSDQNIEQGNRDIPRLLPTKNTDTDSNVREIKLDESAIERAAVRDILNVKDNQSSLDAIEV